MASRHRARKGEGQLLRGRILDVADRLLLERGSAAAVPIGDIAAAAGCTPPAIYMHFADKDSLLFEVAVRQFFLFSGALEDAAAQSDDPFESLKAVGRAYVDFGLKNPAAYRILFMQRDEDTGLSLDPVIVQRSPAFTILQDVVERCLEADLLPQGDAFEVSCTLWVLVHGVTSLKISKPSFPWPDVDEVIDFAINAGRHGLTAERHGLTPI